MKALMRALLPALCLVALSAASVQAAGNPNPGLVPPQAHPHGMSIGDWGLAWWSWALNTGVEDSPLLDQTGEDAWVDQDQKVFFLAGTFGGNAERTITIPTGTTLFWPIYNRINWYVPVPGGPTYEEREAQIRATYDAHFAAYPEENLSLVVDGVPFTNLKSYRVQSDDVPFYVAPGSVGASLGVPTGWWEFAIADGIWIMMTPLPPGEHTITSRAGPVDNPFIVVTYHITVEPGKNAK